MAVAVTGPSTPLTLPAETVSLWRAPVVRDSYNSDVRDWPNATQVAAGIASVQPSFGSEDDIDRQTTTNTWRLFTASPALYVALATDRVLWRGVFYDIDSPPDLWFNRGRPHHLELTLRLTEG